MPRLNVINPKEATGRAKELYNGPLRGKHLNIFKGVANNPNVLEAFLGFMNGVKSAGAFSESEHEIIALVAAGVTNCEYCAAAHSRFAAGAGINEAIISQALEGRADDADDRQTAIINFTQAVMKSNGYVSDEDLATFRSAGFGDDAIVELIGSIAVNSFTNLFNHVNETEIDRMFQPAMAK